MIPNLVYLAAILYLGSFLLESLRRSMVVDTQTRCGAGEWFELVVNIYKIWGSMFLIRLVGVRW
jgi:hypothetical protein